MARLRYTELQTALLDAGVTHGSTVMVQSSLLHIGPVEGVHSRERFAEFYYRALREAVGEEGTILVHTPFEQYGRYAHPFEVENSPSTAGILSEYVRRLPKAVRSVHPIVSVAGVGPRAAALCGGNHSSGFGWDSPWARMHQEDIIFLCLGLGLAKGLSFLHHIEAMFGVPYQYTKLYTTPVYSNGRELPGPFTLSVRYLDFGIQYNYLTFERRMIDTGAAVEARFERGLLFQSARARAAFQCGIQCLAEDRFCFLEQPPQFRPGEIPMDGATGDMKLVYHRPR
jgi:aminoglycoside 3-N-acetyltransferase